MRSILITALTASVLSAGLVGQYNGEGPGIVVPQGPSTKITIGILGNGVTEISQIYLAGSPLLGINVYYGCFTVRRTGGTGGWDAMTGIYDGNTNTFTKNNDVDAMNSTGDEFAATVSPDLMTFAMDTPTGPIYANRASTSGPFGTPAPIGGLSGYVDPMFGQINGQLSLFYVAGVNLAVADFAAGTGTLSNIRILVTNPIGAGCHSPSPMSDFIGATRALIFSAQVPGFSSNAWFTSALNDSAPKFEMLSSSTWLANPDANGGTITYAEATGATYGVPLTAGILAMNSASIPSGGGTLNLTVWGPQRTPAQSQYTALAFLGMLGTSGVQVPGFLGKPISLNLASFLIPLPTVLLDRAIASTTYSIPTPGLPPGAQFAGMPALVDFTAGSIWFGNTSFITVN